MNRRIAVVAALMVLGAGALCAQDGADARTYGRKAAGFGAGVTASALIFSLDGVLGSSCTGSGNYLGICRSGYFGITLLGGGVGALIGSLARSPEPPGTWSGALLGSAVGAMGAFLASTVRCEQERTSNPRALCGYDGMVSAGTVGASALVGGVIGGLLARDRDGPLQLRELGPVQTPEGLGLGVGLRLKAGR